MDTIATQEPSLVRFPLVAFHILNQRLDKQKSSYIPETLLATLAGIFSLEVHCR